MPIRTPSCVPTERIANRRGLLKEEPTIRPVAIVPRSCLELPVLLKDRLGFDHSPKHRLALQLQLGILVGGVPIIAGARKQAFGR